MDNLNGRWCDHYKWRHSSIVVAFEYPNSFSTAWSWSKFVKDGGGKRKSERERERKWKKKDPNVILLRCANKVEHFEKVVNCGSDKTALKTKVFLSADQRTRIIKTGLIKVWGLVALPMNFFLSARKEFVYRKKRILRYIFKTFFNWLKRDVGEGGKRHLGAEKFEYTSL